MASFDVFLVLGKITDKEGTAREGLQRSGIFILGWRISSHGLLSLSHEGISLGFHKWVSGQVDFSDFFQLKKHLNFKGKFNFIHASE